MDNELNVLDNQKNFDRWSEETGTCYGKLYDSFLEGFFSQFHDSFFYALVLQFVLVALMYSSIGKGIYWKVLFYASIAGLLGTLCENSTVALVCQDSKRNTNISNSQFILLLIDEIFWIVSEYAIPYLNLIKMKAFAKGKLAVVIRYTIIALIIPFVICRVMIGYSRMTKGYLQDSNILKLHGYAFGVMAIADLLCSFAILYFVRKNNNHVSASTSLNHYVKHSSYTILVAVDIVSCLLSILDIVTNVYFSENKLLKSVSVPLHCFKSSFILILAIDALLFKYGANILSINESTSGNNSKTYNNSGHNLSPYKTVPFNKNANNKSYGSYTIEMSENGGIKTSPTNPSYQNKKSNVSNIASYNFPSLDKHHVYSNQTSKVNNNNTPNFSAGKSIVKNYTTIQTNSILFEADNTNTYNSSPFSLFNNQPKAY